MFSYYGSKSKVVNLYPEPTTDKIIEPFAGSARYALKYWENDVLLVDKYDVIIKIWKYLQQASEKDIMGLPELKYKETTEGLNLSEGERLLMGFLVSRGVRRPQKIVQKFSDIAKAKVQIAGNLHKIRHWKIMQGEYADIPNQEATWFIDAPYQYGGELYNTCERQGGIDFDYLKKWTLAREGQVIVCENTKADWLPFTPLRKMHGSLHTTTEAIWMNGGMDTQAYLF
jgi:hypothetical protein